MIITVSQKPDRVVRIPQVKQTDAVASTPNNLSLGQLRSVDISQAEVNDVLMFDGTEWQAEPLDGGEFN